jgi:23S rRNA (guanosine2251-2'-O)-methyltransferase
MKIGNEHVLLLHNIRSAHNVGSILRTADAVCISQVILSGYTPAPVDRFGRVNKEIAKTALGAEAHISWRVVKNIKTTVETLRKDGYKVVGIEQDKKAIDYKKFKAKRALAFILGNEVRGLSKAVKNMCDCLIEIPMGGAKESLNVSVAAGVALFRVLD